MSISEALGALSIAADIAAGRPKGTALTGTVVSTRLAMKIGLDPSTQKDVYYTSIARFLGCSATAPEASLLALGDDLGFSLAFLLCDWMDLDALRAALMENVALDSKDEDRNAAFDVIISMRDDFPSVVAAHCEQARIFASRLPIPQSVLGCLSHYYARWDGKLAPYKGDTIPIASRTASIGETAELFRLRKGRKAACREIAARSGKQLDPTLCEVFLANADDLFDDVENCSDFDAFVGTEPGDPIPVTPATCAALAEIAADMVDQKSVWFAGHSRRVAALCSDAGSRAGLSSEQCAKLRDAALFHDLGKLTIRNRIWDKTTDLSTAERLEMETHSFQTEFILSHAEPLRSLSSMAGAANERADGSGYHKRIHLTDLANSILAAANEYDVLSHDQPHRKALSAEKVGAVMEHMARDKKINPVAISAVLQAAGHTVKQSEKAYPCHLTRREAQVLTRLARSESTAQIAGALGISEKTADHHIQSIYSKTGVRGRTAIALFAIENAIVMD